MINGKYRKLKPQEQQVQSAENEIKVTIKKRENNYITYAQVQFQEKNHSWVTLKGLGEAIPKVLLVAEILRRRIKGLHQINAITNVIVEERYEPLEIGLETVIVKRTLSMLEVKLTKEPTAEEKKSIGYQEPLPEDQVKEWENKPRRRKEGSGRRRGGSNRGGERDYDRNRDSNQRGYDRDREGGGNRYRGGERRQKQYRDRDSDSQERERPPRRYNQKRQYDERPPKRHYDGENQKRNYDGEKRNYDGEKRHHDGENRQRRGGNKKD